MLGIIKSFKPSFYKKICNQSLGRSYGFLVVFVLVISLLIASQTMIYVNKNLPSLFNWIDNNFYYAISDVPEIQIEDGQLKAPTTNYIKEWGNDFVFLVMPDSQDNLLAIKDYDNAALLTRDSLILKFDKGNSGQSDIKLFDLTKVKSLTLTPDSKNLNVLFEDKNFNLNESTIKTIVRKLAPMAFPIVFVYIFFLYLLIKPLQILIFSLGGLIINSLLNAKLAYKQLLNIGTYALAPSVLIVLFLQFFNFHFFLLYIIIYFTYLYLGIKAAKAIEVEVKEIECQS